MRKGTIEPIFPLHGDVLHALDGTVGPEGLITMMRVAAPAGSMIRINNVPAVENGDHFFLAPLVLSRYSNTVTIRDENSQATETIKVYYASRLAKKYRLSIDDNIRFLQDIAEHADVYRTIFDNPFLNVLRELHRTYGVKVHLNLFYESVGGDFTLSMFPEKFKAEWEAQRDWIRLSFHAYREFPDAPYQDASYQTVKKDCDLVLGEIRRFAGEALLGPVTTIHWGAVNRAGSSALRAAGYKGQLGYFNVDDDLPPVSYYLSVEERRHMKKRFIWKDESEDIIFIRSSMVLDKTAPGEIVPKMEAYAGAESGLPPYVDYLIHEQYFYPDYEAYEPDYMERIERAVKWAREHGYTPAFLEECIFE